ncbi:EF-hand domain and EF-hand domain pair-containing protein [Strongyloides ratti]|uniref:EF-hand domain and EF-hand domain pair-containing protein n=1 Tax=Strongyloides ratti TaxID=34506 RepID=A0A090KWN2_STRRB|nr:EF-hand domain and EF-hand domain pair-containing protein [Strongyloides ratti]CEF61920.1 EF-hand domain and EF-hand domain pair-containing protein [Strongyloides ratti]
MGQLDLSLLEISTEDLKFSKRNIEDFLNNLKVVAESLRIRSNQFSNKNMDFESSNDCNNFSRHELNDENIDDIESLVFYENKDNLNNNKKISEQKYFYNDRCSSVSDNPVSSKNITSPRPPSSPRLIKDNSVIDEINVFLKSPRRKEDELDEATVVKQFSQFSSNKIIDEVKVKKNNSLKSSPRLNQPLENKENVIPCFYFPAGRPPQSDSGNEILKNIENVFKKFPKKILYARDFDQVCEAVGKPITWSRILINGCLRKDASDDDTVTYEEFSSYWLKLSSECFDNASTFIKLLVDGNSSNSKNNIQRKYVVREDFKPLLNYIIFTIRDLDVLKNAPSFHSAYVDTVIARIFWRVSRSWIGKISTEELRKSNFLDIFGSLNTIENINDEKFFFSYIHFYVIYCKFWELDEDHDLMITSDDLKKYSNETLPSRVIDRIIKINGYSKNVSGTGKVHEVLDYSDFILLLLADENKHHLKALEYWFRILDINGDGKLSLEELEYFHEEIMNSVKDRVIECKSMSDTLCHIFDMISPVNDHYITLNDIKKKQELTDGEIPQSCEDNEVDVSEWDNYCTKQYELIVEDVDDSFNCGDDLEGLNFFDIDSDSFINVDD